MNKKLSPHAVVPAKSSLNLRQRTMCASAGFPSLGGLTTSFSMVSKNWAWLLLPILGCSFPPQEEETLVVLDRAVFEISIEGMLQKRCANPSCHGRVERPFSIYAPGRFRMDENRVFLDEALGPREKEHNFWAASVFASMGGDVAEQRTLMQKPLGTAVYHGGGPIFIGEKEGDARVLIDWIAAEPPSNGEHDL